MLAETMPPTIGAAMRRITPDPVPEPYMIGSRPTMIVTTVMSSGRRRSSTPSAKGSRPAHVFAASPCDRARISAMFRLHLRPGTGPLALALSLLAGGCSREAPSGPALAQDANAGWLGVVEALDPPAVAGSRYPHLASTPAGNVVASWLEPAGEDTYALRFARLDQAWQPARTVATGRDWFVNWADFPSVVPFDGGPWVAHWLQQRPGNVYAYDVKLAVSDDTGATWSMPFTAHDDGTPTEHGFVSIGERAGRPYVAWLDGRRTSADGHAHEAGEDPTAGSMTLRGGHVDARGVHDGSELDARVCDCCRTDAARTGDALLVVYRDRSDDEVRDVLALRLGVDGSVAAPVPVHADGWRIAGCPVNGPAVAARGDEVAVAWFTAPDRPRVRLAFSADGGRSFDAPIEVSTGRTAGRVDVVLLQDGRAVVSWLAESPSGGALLAQPFTRHGAAAAATMIADQSVARSSGFPQMVLSGADELVFAWTDPGNVPRVRAARARLR